MDPIAELRSIAWAVLTILCVTPIGIGLALWAAGALKKPKDPWR